MVEKKHVFLFAVSLLLLAMPNTVRSHSFLLQLATNYCSKTGELNITAPWYCSQINQAVANAWASWAPAGLLLITLSLMLGALIFSIGVAFRNSKIRIFGQGELYEAFATAIFVIFFMLVVASMVGYIPGIFTGNIDPYDTALMYIYNTIQSVNTLLSSLFANALFGAFLASIGIVAELGEGVSFGTGSLVLNQGTAKLANFAVKAVVAQAATILFVIPAESIGSLLVDGLLVLHTEFYLLIFSMYAAIPVFLVPGVLLRSFLPTRSVGGMMIGAAIGFFVAMPLLFSIAFYFSSPALIQAMTSQTAALNNYGQSGSAIKNMVSPSAPLVESISNIQSSMGTFWLAILFYPALIMALTYYVIVSVAEFLGGVVHRTGAMTKF